MYGILHSKPYWYVECLDPERKNSHLMNLFLNSIQILVYYSDAQAAPEKVTTG